MSGSNQLYNKNFSNQSGLVANNIVADGLNVSQGVLLATTPASTSNNNEIATTAFVKTAITNSTTFNSVGGNIYYNGNIGINKSSPVYPLDVSGTINTSSNILCNGNIGIGITSPAYQLDVSGIIRSSSDMLIRNTGWLRFENTGGMYWTTFGGGLTMTDTSFVRVHNGKSFYCAGNICSTGSVGVGIGATSPSYALDVSGVIRATNNILCGSKLGIGTTTPAYALDVVGDIRSSSTVYTNNIRPYSGSSITFGTVSRLEDNGTHSYIRNTNVGAVILSTNNGTKQAYLDSTGNFTIDSGGLTASGDVRSSSTVYTNNIRPNSGSTIGFGSIGLLLDDGGNIAMRANNSTSWLYLQTNNATKSLILKNDGSVIVNDGYLGIGCTPAYSLDTVGNGRISGGTLFISNNAGSYISNNGTNMSYSTPGSHSFGQSVGIGTSSPAGILDVCATQPNFYMRATGQATDSKAWGMGPNGTTLYFGTVDDTNVWRSAWLQVSRIGTAISSILFPTTTPVQFNGGFHLNNVPMFSATSSNQTVSVGSTSVIINPSVVYNIGSCYNSSTGVFTPNVAGYYQVIASSWPSSISGSAISLRLFRNGSYFRCLGNGTWAANAYYIVCGASSIVYLNGSTDYISLNLYCSGPNSVQLSGVAENDNFSVHYLRSG